MKKFLLLALSIVLFFSLLGCYGDKNGEKTNDAPTESNNELYTVDTEYYTISVPYSWKTDSSHKIIKGDNSAYTLTFYDKASRNASKGGELFSIVLLTEYEDYSSFPDHKVLGSLEVSQTGSYNIVVTYPADTQFPEQTAKKYNEMRGDINEILNSISYKDKCVFSTSPIPIKKAEIISRANGNWTYSENGIDGINLIIFGDGTFIKAPTVNGATSPEKIITGTYEILSDDGNYQEFHFTPGHEQFEDWTASIFQTQLLDPSLGICEVLIYIAEDGTQMKYTGVKFTS